MSLNAGIPCGTTLYKLFPLRYSFLHYRNIEDLTETEPDDATSITKKVGNYMIVYSPRQPRQRLKQSMELHVIGSFPV